MFISIVVPVYNIEKYIGQCIKSIMLQTYKKLEVILVDDGSTDNSGMICDYYAGLDHRIKVIHQENKGLVSARKKGLSYAAGDYVGFVDGDDYIDKSFYECLLKNLLQSKADFVHSGFLTEEDVFFEKRQNILNGVFDMDEEKRISFIRGSILSMKDGIQITPSIWSKLFKYKFIKEMYFKVPNNNEQGEDRLCLLLCILNANRISVLDETLYHYRKRKRSMTDYQSVDDLRGIGRLYENVYELLGKETFYSKIKMDLDNAYAYNMLKIIKCVKIDEYNINLFLFKKINLIKNKRIILYGAGLVGQDYYNQICKYQECNIVAWVDLNYKKYKFDYCKVEDVRVIRKYTFDYIVIALKDLYRVRNIKYNLIEKYNIEEDRIIF